MYCTAPTVFPFSFSKCLTLCAISSLAHNPCRRRWDFLVGWEYLTPREMFVIYQDLFLKGQGSDCNTKASLQVFWCLWCKAMNALSDEIFAAQPCSCSLFSQDYCCEKARKKCTNYGDERPEANKSSQLSHDQKSDWNDSENFSRFQYHNRIPNVWYCERKTQEIRVQDIKSRAGLGSDYLSCGRHFWSHVTFGRF